MNVLIAFDQLGNAVCFGSPDETISSRLGKLKRASGGIVPKRAWLYLARPLDATLEWIDPNHSIDAIEEDEDSEKGKPSREQRKPNWPRRG